MKIPDMKPKALVCLLLWTGSAAGAVVPANFAHVRDVAGPGQSAPALAEIRLDAAILASTRPGFPDLRVFDDRFREIPFLVEPLVEPRERIVRRPVAAHSGKVLELAANRFEVWCDLEPGEPMVNAVEIRTPLRDFIRTVRIAGTADGEFWQPLAEAEIYDYSRFLDFRRTVVSLPANDCRTFKIEIFGAAADRVEPFARLVEADGQSSERAETMRQAPFQIGSIAFWQTAVDGTENEPVLQEWPPADVETTRYPAARTTEFLLATRRAPLTQVELESSVPNFNRLVTVQVPNGERWRTVADGIISRISVPEFATNALVVRFPEQRPERLRVVVQHANERPVKFSGIRAFGPSYRLVWIAEPGIRYRLAYGADLVEADGGDVAPIQAALANGGIPQPWRLAPPDGAEPAPVIAGGPSFSDYVPGGILLGLGAGAWYFAVRARKKNRHAHGHR